jgi:hypothetical protein
MDTEYTKAFKAGYDFGYKDAANENRYNTGVKVGIAYEQDRIIQLLETKKTALENIDTGHAQGSEINSIRTKTIEAIIEYIKGIK